MTECLVVEHVASEPAWAIGAALECAGVRVRTHRVFEGHALPEDLSGYDGMVVMGGPMSASSDDGFPTRTAELALLADSLARGVPTLGVCLGAQLLALAAGARVHAGGSGPEIGWGAVRLTAARFDDPLLKGLPERLDVLHWHGDTFSLPAGARHLAQSARYANQAFRLGDVAWGLQFHLEVTVEAVEGLLRAFPGDAARAAGGAGSVQRATPAALAALVPLRDQVFERFASLVAAGCASPDGDGSRGRFADVSDS